MHAGRHFGSRSDRRGRIKLRDGSELQIRPITPEDRDALLENFEHLSAETRYRRFLAPIKRLTASQVTYFTEVDHRDHEALIALTAEGEIVGVARYIRLRDQSEVGEVAVTVADAWQGRGLGTILLHRLAERARHAGVDVFRGICLSGNRDMQQLLRELGPDVESRQPEAGCVEIDVELPAEGLPSRLARVIRTAARGHHHARMS